MKKLLSLSAILLMVGMFAIPSSSFARGDEGSKPHLVRSVGASDDVPVRVYQLVRYPEDKDIGVALSAGDVVLWDCVSDDGVTVNVKSSAMSVDAVAGVVISTTIQTADTAGVSSVTASNDVGHRNWGYIQVYGLCSTVNVTGGPANAGGALYASTTARYATSSSSGSVRDGNARTLGFAYDASEQGQSTAFIAVD